MSIVDTTTEVVDQLRGSPPPQLARLIKLASEALPNHPTTDWTEEIGRSIVCGYLTANQAQLSPAATSWLLQSANELCRPILAQSLRLVRNDNSNDSWIGQFTHSHEPIRRAEKQLDATERFLAEVDNQARQDHGAFYTPIALADFMVRKTESYLRDEQGKVDGLLDPSLTTLDPALGSAVFPTAIVRHCHKRHCQSTNTTPWSEVVPQLIPRLFGVEIMLPSLVSAHIQLAAELAVTDYDFSTPCPIQFSLGDALSSRSVAQHQPFDVVIGNPPYSRGSLNQGQWIRDLIHEDDAENSNQGYFTVNGEPLGERKQWLHDDYVKFFRVTQCLLHARNEGVLAFVTNHGYLDNTTFRGMRQSLLKTFNRIDIVNLHGNQKKLETQKSSSSRDESVFPISQGTAIGFFRRVNERQQIRYISVQGSKEQKLARLSKDDIQNGQPVTPESPHYFFVPGLTCEDARYDQSVSLVEAFETYSPAVVTARDNLVIGFDRSELESKLEVFCDGQIDDEEIRQRFFARARSSRYSRGDTRGWKLAEARRAMRSVDWRELIRPCNYRPFDTRLILWSPSMIDWPRTQAMESLHADDNLAIVARRQMVPGKPANYFWIANSIALDGLIRSDNRGGESVFALYSSTGEPNFSKTFLSRFPSSCPREVFNYIYGLFFLPAYRNRFERQLYIDFPRVLVPGTEFVFDQISAAGKRLIDLHLLKTPDPTAAAGEFVGEPFVAPGYPKFTGHCVEVSNGSGFPNVSQPVSEYQVGGHQVCRKWLKDRRGRQLSAHEIEHYRQIVSAIESTIHIEQSLNNTIDLDRDFPQP